MKTNDISDAELDDALKDASIDIPNFVDEKGNVEWYALAMYLIKKHHIKTLAGVKREIFVYQDGLYVSDKSVGDVVKKSMHQLIGKHASIQLTTQVLEAIKDLTSIDRDSISEDINLINLNNGVIDLRTWSLLPHDPKYAFFTKIPINYDPDKDCPRIKSFLADILDADLVGVIQELFGYVLYRKYFIKKAFIFVGDGDTGKTTLINLIYAFLGEKNVCGISLQSLVSNKFAGGSLYHKLANLYDDLSSKDVNDNGPFKIATGGGIISAEKKFMDAFVFKNYAKLIFACNKIPDVKESADDAYFLRWIVIPFSRVIEEDKKDRQLIDKLTSPDELSGMLNFALAGLKRLLESQHFSYEKDTYEIKVEMMRSASSVARFAGDELVEEPGKWISLDDMYDAYTEFCSQEKIPAVSKKTFGGKLPMSATYIAQFRPKNLKTSKQVLAWRNVKFRRENIPEATKEELSELDRLFDETLPIDSIS